MAITAADVKRLRDLTGAGMMDAKKALTETDGDFDLAVETLRVKGQAKAAKRGAEREATAGLVATAGGALVELNSETDFVAKSEEFVAAAQEIAAAATASKASDAETLRAATIPGLDKTVGELVEGLAVKIGEKIELGRVADVPLEHPREGVVVPAVQEPQVPAEEVGQVHPDAQQRVAHRPVRPPRQLHRITAQQRDQRVVRR